MGENISIEQLIGGLVIIAGVMLVTLSGRSSKQNNSRSESLIAGETTKTAVKKAEIA